MLPDLSPEEGAHAVTWFRETWVIPWQEQLLGAKDYETGLADFRQKAVRNSPSRPTLNSLDDEARRTLASEEFARVVMEIRARSSPRDPDDEGQEQESPLSAPFNFSQDPSKVRQGWQWIRWAKLLKGARRQIVLAWVLELDGLDGAKQTLLQAAEWVEGDNRQSLAKILEHCGGRDAADDSESSIRASCQLAGAMLNEREPSYLAALERFRALDAAACYMPYVFIRDPRLAASGAGRIRSWAPQERRGVGLWLLTQLEDPLPLARELLDNHLADQASLNRGELDLLSPHLGHDDVCRMLNTVPAEWVVDCRQALARLAELGRAGKALQLLGPCAPDHSYSFLAAQRGVLPHLPPTDRVRLARSMAKHRSAAHWPEVLASLPDDDLLDIETRKLRGISDRAYTLAALPSHRIRQAVSRWLSEPVLSEAERERDRPELLPLIALARRGSELDDAAQNQLFWWALEACAGTYFRLEDALQPVEHDGIAEFGPLLRAVSGDDGLWAAVLATRAVLLD